MTTDTDLTAHDLAEQVIAWDAHASKAEWGEELLRLIHEHDVDGLHGFVHGQTVRSLGAFVSSVKASMEKKRQYERQLARGISAASGRPVKPTMSIRQSNGSTTLSLIIEATPQQYVEAVLRESRVVNGRQASNEIRMQVVEAIQADERLQNLPSLAHVLNELGVDPDTLDLDELGA